MCKTIFSKIMNWLKGFLLLRQDSLNIYKAPGFDVQATCRLQSNLVFYIYHD